MPAALTPFRIRAPITVQRAPLRSTPSLTSTRWVAAQATGGTDAAKKALQDMFKGSKDVLAANEERRGGGGDGNGEGSGGGGGESGGSGWNFDWNEWWGDFKTAWDPWLRFAAAAFVLSLVPFSMAFAGKGFYLLKVLLRLENSSQSDLKKLTERAKPVEDAKGELGDDEKSVLAKYGDGTDDVYVGPDE